MIKSGFINQEETKLKNLGALNQGRRVNKAPRFLKKEFI